MIFKESLGFQHPIEIKYEDFVTWIQQHNLSITYMTATVVWSFGEMVGRVLEVEVNDGRSYLGQFARVQISRSITKPLQCCVIMAMEDGLEERIILIRYGKLLNFCGACGCVGHILRHYCDISVNKIVCTFSTLLRAGRVMDSQHPRTKLGRHTEFGMGIDSGGSRSSNSMGVDGAGRGSRRQKKICSGEWEFGIDGRYRETGKAAVDQLLLVAGLVVAISMMERDTEDEEIAKELGGDGQGLISGVIKISGEVAGGRKMEM